MPTDDTRPDSLPWRQLLTKARVALGPYTDRGDVAADSAYAALRAALAAAPATDRERLGLRAADAALALPHRDDGQPCGCDSCMDYAAEDEGVAWHRLSPERRITLRVLDSGDERLSPLRLTIREHEAAAEPGAGEGLDVETLAEAWHDEHRGEYPGARGLIAVEWRYLTDAERDSERRTAARVLARLHAALEGEPR